MLACFVDRGCLKMALKTRWRGENGVAGGENVGKMVPSEGVGCDVVWRGSGECVEVDVSDGSKHEGSL